MTKKSAEQEGRLSTKQKNTRRAVRQLEKAAASIALFSNEDYQRKVIKELRKQARKEGWLADSYTGFRGYKNTKWEEYEVFNVKRAQCVSPGHPSTTAYHCGDCGGWIKHGPYKSSSGERAATLDMRMMSDEEIRKSRDRDVIYECRICHHEFSQVQLKYDLAAQAPTVHLDSPPASRIPQRKDIFKG